MTQPLPTPPGHLLRGAFVGALVAFTGCAQPESATLDVDPALLRTHVAALAHDSMRGRDTDDIGYERARDYVAGQYARLGLSPLQGDSYLQPFDLLEVVSDLGSSLIIGDDVIRFPEVMITPDWVGMPAAGEATRAEGVFVGHQLVSGALDAATLDLSGKVAFVLAGAPDGRGDEPEVAMRERAEVELARRAGAVAVVVLNPTTSEAAWSNRTNPRRPVRVLADGTAPSQRPDATVGPASSQRLLARWTEPTANTGNTGNTAGVAVTVGPVTLTPAHEIQTVTSWNVGGVLPGADPVLKDEVVVFTAHLDHVGIGPPNAAGDSIYNGAHDNALGVAKVLAAAEAMVGLELKRSVLFLMVGAEESGLLGSWHYLKNPVFPIPKTAASINHDGGLMGDARDDVLAWGPEFSTVEGDVIWAATETGLDYSRERKPPFTPSAGLLYRSDHYPFLTAGVPAIYLMPGFTVDGDPGAGQRAWQSYLGSIHHAQPDNFDPSASYGSPVALTAMSIRLAVRLADADGMPTTHEDAPVAGTRQEPTGYFFRDPS
ncbi:MAG: M28 family peptidase [Longimicrobiales bacterium]